MTWANGSVYKGDFENGKKQNKPKEKCVHCGCRLEQSESATTESQYHLTSDSQSEASNQGCDW